MNVTINHEQRLFVIPAGGGYTCLGFDFCFYEASQLAERLGETLPGEEQRGTLEQYLQYQELLSKARLGTWFHRDTPKAVRDILESAHKSGTHLRLFYGDTQTGRDWLEEFDVIGTIGRSTGGGAVLDNCIVRIIDAATGYELYRHPRYVTPVFGLRHSAMTKQPWEVLHNGQVHPRFETAERARRWIAFIRGERFTK